MYEGRSEYKIEIPGYKHITWFEAKDGQEVWLQGRALDLPHAYGPHTVVSKHRRTLRNVKGNEFMHYAEDLVLPE
jgi:hypothetical protein